MKTLLFNCHDKLHCAWKELRCTNPLPGARAATKLYSCAFDTVAMIISLLRLLVPASFAGLNEYPDLVDLTCGASGELLWPGKDFTPR